jgi:hypothetical protein
MTISGLPTSYFSSPAQTLDPTLFEGRALRSWVVTGINSLLSDFLSKEYRHPELWAHPWLAGSGVSYQWTANREPKDLDCLVGVNYIQFRKANPEFQGLTDKEISDQLNEQFKTDLQLLTENWNGYELTFYVNPGATDIRTIKPYAAYDLKYNEWTVTPNPIETAPQNVEWDRIADNDRALTTQVTTRFNQALQDIKSSHNDALRRNSEVKMTAAVAQGNALFNEIHQNRTQAFSPTGEGYQDFHNYRWQAAKRSGVVSELKSIREYMKASLKEQNPYGVDLPDSDTLIRRAAIYRAK